MAHVKEQGLVSFLALSKPKIPFLGLSLLRNQTETLATQAIQQSACHTTYSWKWEIRVIMEHQIGLKLTKPYSVLFYHLYTTT